MDYSPLWILNFISKKNQLVQSSLFYTMHSREESPMFSRDRSGERFSATHLLPETPRMQRTA